MRQRVSHIKRSLAYIHCSETDGNIYIRNVCESEGLFPFVSRFWMSTCSLNCGGNALKKVFADSITMLKYTAKSSGNEIIYGPLL